MTQKPTQCESDGKDIFVVFNGVRVAKRGHPNTPQAGTWIALEPGFAVYDDKIIIEITVERNDVLPHGLAQ
jgi:hypothetical protein